MESTKDLQKNIVDNMKRWKNIENASVESTGKIISKTTNPVVRLVMEIIQQDSQLHYRIQDFISKSIESMVVTLTPDELADVWDMIENHIKLEKKTMDLADEALSALKGKKMVVQEYLINYLMKDETKHNQMLDALENIKKGMNPY